MRIFITGSTGFIGRKVCRRLAGEGHQLNCLVRKTSDTREIESLGVQLFYGDINDRTAVLEAMENCEASVNLANLYSFWEPDLSAFEKTNVDGTRSVLSCAIEKSLSHVIQVSSAVIYGKPADEPFTEESTPSDVLYSEYAYSKRRGDEIAWELYRTTNLPLTVIYPAPVLGAGDPKTSGRWIENIARRRLPITYYSKAPMTFVHVDDVSEAISRVLARPETIGRKYLLGKYQMGWREIAEYVGKTAGVRIPESLPHCLATPTVAFTTLFANITKIPPPWDMAFDLLKTVRAGLVVDGSRAERELELTYTPIQTALLDEIASAVQSLPSGNIAVGDA